MAHFKRKTQTKRVSKIIYGKGIIEDIVVIALSDVPYIELYSSSSIKKIQSDAVAVSITKDGVIIDVNIKIHYSQNVSDIAFNVQEIIRREVESMTEYKILEVNVHVLDVIFSEIKKNKPIVNDQKEKENDANLSVTDNNINDKEAVSTELKTNI